MPDIQILWWRLVKRGAEGGTILFGRGTGIREQAKLFSIQIEPEKELVLTLMDRDKTENVLEAILIDAQLNKPGKGIAFVLPVERTVGINHINDLPSYLSATNRLVNCPSFSMAMVTSSPGCKYTCFSGGYPSTTPSGVPVKITSPGYRVMCCEM